MFVFELPGFVGTNTNSLKNVQKHPAVSDLQMLRLSHEQWSLASQVI